MSRGRGRAHPLRAEVVDLLRGLRQLPAEPLNLVLGALGGGQLGVALGQRLLERLFGRRALRHHGLEQSVHLAQRGRRGVSGLGQPCRLLLSCGGDQVRRRRRTLQRRDARRGPRELRVQRLSAAGGRVVTCGDDLRRRQRRVVVREEREVRRLRRREGDRRRRRGHLRMRQPHFVAAVSGHRPHVAAARACQLSRHRRRRRARTGARAGVEVDFVAQFQLVLVTVSLTARATALLPQLRLERGLTRGRGGALVLPLDNQPCALALSLAQRVFGHRSASQGLLSDGVSRYRRGLKLGQRRAQHRDLVRSGLTLAGGRGSVALGQHGRTPQRLALALGRGRARLALGERRHGLLCIRLRSRGVHRGALGGGGGARGGGLGLLSQFGARSVKRSAGQIKLLFGIGDARCELGGFATRGFGSGGQRGRLFLVRGHSGLKRGLCFGTRSFGVS